MLKVSPDSLPRVLPTRCRRLAQQVAQSLCTSNSAVLGMETAEKPQSFWKAKLCATHSRQPFEEALERAALAIDDDGKRFSHQRRLRGSPLRNARNILSGGAQELRRCDSFDQLHNLIKEHLNGIRGLGRLYYYDTALRIGASLRLMPKRVYLHRGTRDGARALGLDWRADSLDPRALRKELAVLEPHEIEDFFCMYKDQLRPEMR